ncbi:hypothetical protein RUND412_000687 [Rhizina undulata]
MTNMKSKMPDVSAPSSSALIICRNKHWRFISSFHGPWLQLPPEILESLAHSNYQATRPHPIHPAVLYDLVKIRKLVDEATNLAVRAASGVAASGITKDVSLLGGSVAGALGIGGSGNAPRLSRERKHRMREQATQKLAKAYALDDIAASVATMQSASALEDVARLVLERNPNDPEAKYVHFFHEKIPSRMLAKSTSLKPLDDVIAEKPGQGAPLRTRAVTKGFKDDLIGAVQDLTNALNICKMRNAHDANMRKSNGNGGQGGKLSPKISDEGNPEEEDQPSSLEMQLFFHRASTYLTIACQNVVAATPSSPKASTTTTTSSSVDRPSSSSSTSTSAGTEAEAAAKKRDEARKIVRTNAKRALRDYLKFLSFLEYCPGLTPEATEEIIKVAHLTAKLRNSHLREKDSYNNLSACDLDLEKAIEKIYEADSAAKSAVLELVKPRVYPVSTLFTNLPSTLPPFPPNVLTRAAAEETPNAAAAAFLADSNEAVTYHPLLADALHSLLLCHMLIQAPPKEILRHAYMVARLARVCDGYPVFLAARSPARADWLEVLRKTNDYIGVSASWEQLCSPPMLPASLTGVQHPGYAFMPGAPLPVTIQQEKERVKAENGQNPKPWSLEDMKEYPICTERAGLVARWVKDGLRKEKAAAKEREAGKLKAREAAAAADVANEVEVEA